MNDAADPNVRVPQQVQDAATRANEIAAQIKAPPPPRSITNVSDISEGPPPAPQLEDWEHKFNSMKGRYDATEQRARQQANQISELQRLLAMSSGPTPPPAPTPPQNFQAPSARDTQFGGGQPYIPPKLISEDEEKEYGKEVLDVMGRRTMEIVGPDISRLTAVVNQLLADNQQLKAQVGGVRTVVNQDATGRFYDILDRDIPDWEATNHDPEFVRWLGNIDPFSGRVRKDLLDEAHRQNEATRVINIFRGYRQERAAVNPAGNNLQPTVGNASPNGGRAPPQLELQSLAAPGRAKSGQPVTPPDQPFYSPADIKQFYADVTKGLYQGRDADKTALERQLFQAAKEGRIR